MPLAAKAPNSQPHTVVTMLDLAAWMASASSQAVMDVQETIIKDRLTALALSQDTSPVEGWFDKASFVLATRSSGELGGRSQR